MRSRFTHDLLAPFPGRCDRALEVCAAAMAVVIVSMTFQIPSPATSTYVIFFAAKENAGLNIVTSLVFIVVVTLIIGLLFLLAPVSLNNPTLRIVVIAAVSFAAFFLEASSKLAPLSSTIGLVTAYGLDLLQDSFVGEITTRGLFYAWLFVFMPMAVFIFLSTLFGRKPHILLRRNLAARIRCVAATLNVWDDANRKCLSESLREGNAELHHESKMIKLFHYLPKRSAERLSALTSLTYTLMMTVDAFSAKDVEEASKHDLAPRLERLARRIESRKGFDDASKETVVRQLQPYSLVAQADEIAARMADIAAGHALPDSLKEEAEKKEKVGFFVKDAFANPAYMQFALKGTLAVVICYLTFNLLNWPGIHTSMITCFIVALTTIGETVQKMTLRIVGCLAGAALGLLAIVFVLPNTTSITGLVLVIGLVTFPAAWIAVGKPSVAYIGFQAAFALYLCVLQGTEPKFDLTLARDRVFGILFGNIVVYLIFLHVFPTSIRAKLWLDLIHLIEGCRSVIGAIRESKPAVVVAQKVAYVQDLMIGVEGTMLRFAVERKISYDRRQARDAALLDIEAFHDLAHALSRVAAFPPPDVNETQDALVQAELSQVNSGLDAINAALAGDALSSADVHVANAALSTTFDDLDNHRVARFEAYSALQKGLENVRREVSRLQRQEIEPRA